MHSQTWYSRSGRRLYFKVAAESFPSWDTIRGGLLFKSGANCLLSHSGSCLLLVHFKFFRVCETRNSPPTLDQHRSYFGSIFHQTKCPLQKPRTCEEFLLWSYCSNIRLILDRLLILAQTIHGFPVKGIESSLQELPSNSISRALMSNVTRRKNCFLFVEVSELFCGECWRIIKWTLKL